MVIKDERMKAVGEGKNEQKFEKALQATVLKSWLTISFQCNHDIKKLLSLILRT
jgi:hypothetical protein